MTFNEALNRCRDEKWSASVILSDEYLGKNAFIIEQYPVGKNQRVDTSKPKELLLTIYTGKDFIYEYIPGPFIDLDPNSEGWKAGVFQAQEIPINYNDIKLHDAHYRLSNLKHEKDFSKQEIQSYFN